MWYLQGISPVLLAYNAIFVHVFLFSALLSLAAAFNPFLYSMHVDSVCPGRPEGVGLINVYTYPGGLGASFYER